MISIHVPTRGTTDARADPSWEIRFQSTCLREARPLSHNAACWSRHFNPRAYARHDWDRLQIIHRDPFQSTCLREARRKRSQKSCQQPHFNPRAYARHDGKFSEMRVVSNEFQSTCLREARPAKVLPGTSIGVISIHVPTRGTTPSRRPPDRPGRFQSTCLREARQ